METEAEAKAQLRLQFLPGDFFFSWCSHFDEQLKKSTVRQFGGKMVYLYT